MRIRRLAASLAATALAGGAVVGLAPAASAAGTTSLASVLAADGAGFDRSWYDYDIVDNAVAAVLAAKPDSPVAVLADGTVPLTAFLPNDRAFQVLAHDLTHRWYGSEEKVFGALAQAVGIDAIEQVLLYHVVPGATIDSATALASDGAALTTAQGGTFTVDVLSKRIPIVVLRDADRNDLNPLLVRSQLDINAGNAQIAHGISFVLRPLDL
ncbi:fasciclin domain-containing protein [Cellulomonas sp. KH9]|uniref:fasciclin domain-containing protein n=1 Tax=Cellulomonas sp. KH9 TaxID=1855324 RepID=UPI0008EA5CA9|nr:fasciclin domain-containing protein [Cellulomonas sp. KH9]SFK11910.1 Uncaracterized surface protein containing fasciclin (FAS1) repeats [Cellulomonas sp. KH9]SFK56885.1 Uncaracterized surface protein containing fasciclin (FAS1) repeats [Cellulomonas sp. KH9]